MRKCNTVKDLFTYQLSEIDYAFYKTTRQVDLHISPDCTLRCPYCVSQMKKKRPNVLLEKIGVEKYLDQFFKIFGRYEHLNITIAGPGEPSESPYFVPICSKLLEKGYNLRIFSNLSNLPNYLSIASHIQHPGQIKITSSYHFGAFMELGRYGIERNTQFLINLPKIVSVGIIINSMNTPLSPPMLTSDHVKLYFDSVKKIKTYTKVFVTPVELYGTYQGKPYPQSYTEEQRGFVKRIHQRLHYHMEEHGVANKINYTQVSEKTTNRLQYTHNSPHLKGMPCLVSFRHVAIDLQGRMFYCNSTPRFFLPNFLDYNPSKSIFMEKEGICPAEMCNCKSAGNAQCLKPHVITLNEYYYAYYMEHNQSAIAEMFTDD